MVREGGGRQARREPQFSQLFSESKSQSYPEHQTGRLVAQEQSAHILHETETHADDDAVELHLLRHIRTPRLLGQNVGAEKLSIRCHRADDCRLPVVRAVWHRNRLFPGAKVSNAFRQLFSEETN